MRGVFNRSSNVVSSAPLLLQLLRAVYVEVFGRLHDDPIHARRQQAYEKRQWTKSREVGRLRCSGRYEGLIGTATLIRRE